MSSQRRRVHDLNTPTLVEALPNAVHPWRVLPQVERCVSNGLCDNDRRFACKFPGGPAQAREFFRSQRHRVAGTIVRVGHIDRHPAGRDVRRDLVQDGGLDELRVPHVQVACRSSVSDPCSTVLRTAVTGCGSASWGINTSPLGGMTSAAALPIEGKR
jgi:hypothetical protein